MNKRSSNPPAFPRPSVADVRGPKSIGGGMFCEDGQSGMELRDYFAAKALNGMLASDSSVDRTKVNKAKWASVAYQFADAMLEARTK